MFETPAGFLDDAHRFICKDLKDDLKISIILDSLPMDKATCRFRTSSIDFLIPASFSDHHRFGFYLVQYWQHAAKFLAECKNLREELVGDFSLSLDDVGSGEGLAFCCKRNQNQVGMPDPFFIRSFGYSNFRSPIIDREGWNKRSDIVFWRGSSSGYRSHLRPSWRQLPRFELCARAATPDAASLFDVGISNVVQIGNLEEKQAIGSSGYLRSGVPQEKFADYRFTIDIDGNSNSWPGLFTKMLMGNTIFKVDSQEGFYQWYYSRTSKWTHFIPVESDLSDLIEKVIWAHSHMDESFKIATAAQRLANEMDYNSELRLFSEALLVYLNIRNSDGL